MDLLKFIQDQQIANMPFESLGFREITRHCTEWPDWTNFSSVLQHDQNIQDDRPTMQLGGIEYTIGAVGSQEDFADFSIHTTSRGNQMDVTLTYAPNSTMLPPSRRIRIACSHPPQNSAPIARLPSTRKRCARSPQRSSLSLCQPTQASRVTRLLPSPRLCDRPGSRFCMMSMAPRYP